jgi:DNA polymerase-3 subunit alpha
VVTESWENFHYKPTTTGDVLTKYQDGLIVLSGCLGGRLASALLGGKGTEEHEPDLRAAARVASQFKEVFGDRYYLEVQPHPLLDRQRAANQSYARLSRKLGIPLVATGDVHYPTAADQDMYPVLHAIDRGGGRNTVEAQSQGWEYGIVLAHMTAEQRYQDLMLTGLTSAQADGALASTVEIAERARVTLPKLKDLEFPSDIPAEELFHAWVRAGWHYRGIHRMPRSERREYMARVRLEMDLMVRKGFTNYFLVISDMVKWAKDNGIAVGPARGSAAASLVCWLLRITEVNPMHFPNLIFARFIDETRHDLPDVDLDFDDDQRWRIRDYLVRKYGADRVGNIGTFTMYRGKNSLDDAAKVHGIPPFAVEQVKEGLLERSSGDLRAANTIEDSITLFPKVAGVFTKYPKLRDAMRLEGNLKGFSVHAAGLVVSNDPLTDSLAVYVRYDNKGKNIGTVLSIDKYDAEHIGALKIDALGLTTMGVINRCLKMIGMSLEELYSVPLDDQKVFDGFKRNEVVGIFQFDGRAMRSVNREVKPDTFAEICDINALARPGPLHSGAAAEYIMAKHKKKKVERLHPVVTEITAHTQGQIVYQEQILRVVRELGGFTWEEAAHVRKLISKKQGEQAFNRLQSKFLEGATARGVSEHIALRVWKQLVTAGAYAFNAAHCVSYGMLAYWTMWLKQNHPQAFYCAALQKYDPKTKGLDLLKEATSKGILILPPSPSRSAATWRREGDALRAGLTQVPGIGDSMAPTLIAYRRTLDPRLRRNLMWRDFLPVKGFGPGTCAKLESFSSQEDPFGIWTMRKTLAKVRQWLWENGERAGLPMPSSKSDDIPYDPTRGEHTWVGYVKLRNLKDIYELHRSRTGEELDPATVKEPQYVNYVVLTGEDETGPLVVTVHRFGGFYEKYKDEIWDMNPATDLLLVRGYKRNEYRRAIYASELHVLSMGKKGQGK